MLEAVRRTALVQRCVIKNAPADAFGFPEHTEFFDADASGLAERLDRIEAEVASGARRPVPFVSQEMAARIRRGYPSLARNLIFSPERLAFHAVAAVMGPTMLNARHLLVSWAALAERGEDLRRAFGDVLFVRPNAAGKSFTGLSVPVAELGREHAALSQLEHVAADELCVVAPAQAIATTEWRYWVVDGRPVTRAPYRWSDVEASEPSPIDAVSMTPPTEVDTFARAAARRTELIDSAVVMDVVETDLGPRVVELNPLSTSGFHPGMDLAALLVALDDVLI